MTRGENTDLLIFLYPIIIFLFSAKSRTQQSSTEKKRVGGGVSLQKQQEQLFLFNTNCCKRILSNLIFQLSCSPRLNLFNSQAAGSDYVVSNMEVYCTSGTDKCRENLQLRAGFDLFRLKCLFCYETHLRTQLKYSTLETVLSSFTQTSPRTESLGYHLYFLQVSPFFNTIV